jgi:hypothetical protein
MSHAPAKVALAVGGFAPAFGVATLLLGHPWLIAVAMGVGGGLAGLSCWVLFRHPYFEIHETSQEGFRIRSWRAGVEQHSQCRRGSRESDNTHAACRVRGRQPCHSYARRIPPGLL